MKVIADVASNINFINDRKSVEYGCNTRCIAGSRVRRQAGGAGWMTERCSLQCEVVLSSS